jgi:hypothetical protein
MGYYKELLTEVEDALLEARQAHIETLEHELTSTLNALRKAGLSDEQVLARCMAFLLGRS